MACCQPYEIKNPHFNQFGYYQFWKQYIEVPCGWCLNCRVDRQNWLTDACEYEQKYYNYVCAFVTFTYDDIHIQDLTSISDKDFYYYDNNGVVQVAPYWSNREVNYSLRKKDCKDFLKRVRSKVNYFYKKNKIENVDLCRKDFKVLYSAEYGDSFGRPHYHFVFFGLDWQFCKEIFEECWQQGLIDSKPVTSGCFKYVTKYLTKQEKGKLAKEIYDDKGIERPFVAHSLRFGKGLILDQYDYIYSHNLCYKTSNDTLRPVPIYYRNHFFYKKRPMMSYENTNNNMIALGIKSDFEKKDFYNSGSSVIRYSLKKMNQFRKDQALIRHRELEISCEKKGIPIEPLVQYENVSFDSKSLFNELDYKIFGDVVPF